MLPVTSGLSILWCARACHRCSRAARYGHGRLAGHLPPLPHQAQQRSRIAADHTKGQTAHRTGQRHRRQDRSRKGHSKAGEWHSAVAAPSAQMVDFLPRHTLRDCESRVTLHHRAPLVVDRNRRGVLDWHPISSPSSTGSVPGKKAKAYDCPSPEPHTRQGGESCPAPSPPRCAVTPCPRPSPGHADPSWRVA